MNVLKNIKNEVYFEGLPEIPAKPAGFPQGFVSSIEDAKKYINDYKDYDNSKAKADYENSVSKHQNIASNLLNRFYLDVAEEMGFNPESDIGRKIFEVENEMYDTYLYAKRRQDGYIPFITYDEDTLELMYNFIDRFSDILVKYAPR